jgi:PKHD-type hydroxylase|tara:strand:+ start:1788 stop:2342 length:555 start_codon:yes stop_codon:yes gene_type:complete
MSSDILPNHGVTGLSVSQEEIDLFLDYLVEAKGIVAKVNDQGEEIQKKEIRDATIYYIDEKQTRLYQILNKIAYSANKYFKYDINGIEKAQIIHYKAPSNGYEYHIDIGPDGTAAHRKISMSLLLNEEYEGGEICFRSSEKESCTRPKMGEVVLFSSFLSHKVKPVTTGDRYVVVAWFTGPPFR